MLTGYEILQKQKFVKKICDFILKKIADFEKVSFKICAKISFKDIKVLFSAKIH